MAKMKGPSTMFSIPLIFIVHLLYKSNCHQAYKNEYSSCPLGHYSRIAERIWKPMIITSQGYREVKGGTMKTQNREL